MSQWEPDRGWSSSPPSAHGAPEWPRSGLPPPPPSAEHPPPYVPAPPPFGYPYGVVPQVRTSGLAIAALVLGIVWVYGIGSILAVIFGHVSLSQIDRSNGWLGGRGMAIAGLVLGYIGLALLLLVIVIAANASSWD